MTKRRLLIVTDLGRSKYSALKRGLAYSSFFASHPVWSVEYADLNPPTLPASRALSARLSRRAARYLQADRPPPSREDEILERAKQCDVVYLLKTPTAELQQRILTLRRPRVIFDVNDALWLSHHTGFERLNEMLSTADGVICENEYGGNYVRRLNANVRIVPDCTQLDAFDELRSSVLRSATTVRLGWIGSPSTAGFLYKIWEPLEDLFARHSHLELRIVGASPQHLPHFEKVRCTSVLEYDREAMVREALAMDIGLFPLFRVEDSLARGNGKAVVYMAGGAVAACSNIGEHTKLIEDGVNGMLANDATEWLAKLDWLVSQPEDRRRIGYAGLSTIRAELADEVCFQRLVAALDELGGR